MYCFSSGCSAGGPDGMVQLHTPDMMATAGGTDRQLDMLHNFNLLSIY